MSERGNFHGVILVVDDNEDNRELLRIFLNLIGYNVIEASNGIEAIKIATSECPDLILMDLSMPELDGYGAVKILRGIPEICEVPIVACTAHRTHRIQARRRGFTELLAKPIDFGELNRVVDRFLKAA